MHTTFVGPLSPLAEWAQRVAADPALSAPDAELFGRMAFLTDWLRRVRVLPSLPAEHREALASAFVVVPIQAPTMPEDTPAFAWLQVAALAEFRGQYSLARSMVDALARLTADDGEVRAMCEAQRGRIARTLGQLDDAAAHYQDAIRRTTPLPKRDAWPRALCGLANVHLDRGNFPAAERCLRRALGAGPHVAAPTRVHPWMGLALVRRKRRDPIDAMLCAWNAFDLTSPDMPQRADILVTLAECAAEFGDHAAAVNGFVQALAVSTSPRVRIAAVTGLVLARAFQLRNETGGHERDPANVHAAVLRNHLAAAMVQLDDLLEQSLAPQERALALLTRAEASLALHPWYGEARVEAEQYLARAEALVDQHGYHEYRFRADEIRGRLVPQGGPAAAAAASPANTVLPRARRRGEVRPAVIQRLARLLRPVGSSGPVR